VDLKTVVAGAFGLGGGQARSAPRGINKTRPRATSAEQSLLGFRKWDMQKALTDGYEINEWVHACVNAIAGHAATVPWRVSEFADSESKAHFQWEQKGVKASERNDFYKDAHHTKRRFVGYKGRQPLYERRSHLLRRPDDPLEELLEQPNPFNSRRAYIELLMQHKLLGGNAFWVKIRGSVPGIPGYKTTLELWPIFYQNNTLKIDTNEGDEQVPVAYRYNPGGMATEQVWAPQDVVHFSFPNPSDPIWGISPLQAAARSVDTDTQAALFQLNSMNHRGIPDLILSPGNLADGKVLGKREFQEARKQFAQNRVGPRNQPRAPWFVGADIKVQRMGLTSAEVDFVKTRGLNREAICSIFRVFPAVIAITQGVSVTSIDAIMKHHWVQTVIPALDAVMSDIDLFLVKEFPGDRIAWYDTSNVDALGEPLLERMRTSKIPWSMGIPPAEVNRRMDLGFDLEGVFGMEEGFLPASAATVRNIVEGNVTSDGSGNTNTPPDGGDPGEPGDPQAPNEPEAEDPDTGEPGEAEAASASLTMSYFSNGHADPHDGVERWSADDMVAYLASPGLEVEVENWSKTKNHYELGLDRMPVQIKAMADKPDTGVEIEELGEAGYFLRFYHGEDVQDSRDRLVKRVESWGFSTD